MNIRFFMEPHNLLAFAYFKALMACEHTVRVLPLGGAVANDPKWGPYPGAFTAALNGPYINVVCSFKEENYRALWTAGVPNIALISHDIPIVADDVEDDPDILIPYDWVIIGEDVAADLPYLNRRLKALLKSH